MEECFDAAMQFCVGHRKAIYHIYNSANRDLLEQSLMKICEYVVTQFVDHAARGRDIRPGDREIIIHSYKCECFGTVIDWLNSGMKGDAEEKFLRLCELRRGTTATMLAHQGSTASHNGGARASLVSLSSASSTVPSSPSSSASSSVGAGSTHG